MSQPDKKLDKFKSAVLKDAQDQRQKILEEIENFRKAELEKAEEDILHEAYVMIQNEIAAIRNDQSRRISMAEIEGRRKLLKLREELTKKVFDEAASRITGYTNTPAYAELVCKIIAESCAKLPEGPVVIQVKSGDLPLADKLIAASGRSATVEGNPSILLGGVIIIHHDKGLVVDETFDLKLKSQQDWFASSSGLTLGF